MNSSSAYSSRSQQSPLSREIAKHRRHQKREGTSVNTVSFTTPSRRYSPKPAISSSGRSYANDRYIPTRSRTTGKRLGHGLPPRSTAKKMRTEALRHKYNERESMDVVGPDQQEWYGDLLGRVLFQDEIAECEARGYPTEFGSSSCETPNKIENIPTDISRLDVLRTPLVRAVQSTKAKASQHRAVKDQPVLTLDCPDLSTNPRLKNLMSAGPVLAVAVNDAVHIAAYPKELDIHARGYEVDNNYRGLVSDIGGTITAVKWSVDYHHLALGAYEGTHVYDSFTMRKVAEFEHIPDRRREKHVTAICWKNNYDRSTFEFISGSAAGLCRHDVRQSDSTDTFSFDGLIFSAVGSIQWSDSTILATSGNHVHLWDCRRPGKPMSMLRHDCISGAAGWPGNPNLLASVGGDRIKLWNVQSCQMHDEIVSGSSLLEISDLMWSPYGKSELLTSHGNQFGLWNVTSENKIEHVTGWKCRAGAVLSMESLPNSGKILSLHEDEKLFGWHDNFRRKTDLRSSSLGRLQMPVIR